MICSLGILTFILTSNKGLQQPSSLEAKLPILSADKFKKGQEFIWVSEQEATIKTFGGKTLKSSSKSTSRTVIIDIDTGYVNNPDATKGLTGDWQAIELIGQQNHRAGGIFRLANWPAEQDEPSSVYWQDPHYSRSEYACKRWLISFAQSLPSFNFDPIALVGIAKPGDEIVFDVTVGKTYWVCLKANQIVKVDGYDCLEVEGGWAETNVKIGGDILNPKYGDAKHYRTKAYYRLSDGLMQRLADFQTAEHEFEINGVLGTGHTITRGYRLDHAPVKKS